MATSMPVHGIAGLPPRPSFTYDNMYESNVKQNGYVITGERQTNSTR